MSNMPRQHFHMAADHPMPNRERPLAAETDMTQQERWNTDRAIGFQLATTNVASRHGSDRSTFNLAPSS